MTAPLGLDRDLRVGDRIVTLRPVDGSWSPLTPDFLDVFGGSTTIEAGMYGVVCALKLDDLESDPWKLIVVAGAPWPKFACVKSRQVSFIEEEPGGFNADPALGMSGDAMAEWERAYREPVERWLVPHDCERCGGITHTKEMYPDGNLWRCATCGETQNDG